MAEIDYGAKIAETRARLEKLKAQKSKAERAMDTRRKIIAGALILDAIAKNKDLGWIAVPEMKALASDESFALLNLSAYLSNGVKK